MVQKGNTNSVSNNTNGEKVPLDVDGWPMYPNSRQNIAVRCLTLQAPLGLSEYLRLKIFLRAGTFPILEVTSLGILFQIQTNFCKT